MPSITIYVQKDLYQKLIGDKKKNASEIIQEALREHYKTEVV